MNRSRVFKTGVCFGVAVFLLPPSPKKKKKFLHIVSQESMFDFHSHSHDVCYYAKVKRSAVDPAEECQSGMCSSI